MRKNNLAALANMMNVYENNYKQLIQLVPDVDVKRLILTSANDGLANVQIDVLERCKYTTFLKLTHFLGSNDGMIPHLTMKLRVYHDAKLAEVIDSQNQSQFKAVNDYPNKKMHHTYEKRQINLFFGDWLTHCIKNEYSLLHVEDLTNV